MSKQTLPVNQKCLNCDTVLVGEYCSACGQPSSTGTITFKETVKNIFEVMLGLEGSLFLTLKLIVVNPGKLFREFLAGKRKTYYEPVSFFILATATYLILRSLLHFSALAKEFENEQNEVLALTKKSESAFLLLEQNINYVLFFLVFAIGLSLKMFFPKKYNLAEYTSIGLYITGLYTIARIITMVLSVYVLDEVQNIEVLILIALVFYGTLSLFENKSVKNIFKYGMVSILSLFIYVAFMLLFFYIIVSFG